MPDLKQPQINYNVISGRLTADPETKIIQQNSEGQGPLTVCNVTLAADDGWGDKKKSIFLNCTLWGKTAEMAAKLHKGSPVVFEGRLGVDEWDDKNTGQKRSKIVMTVNRVHGLAWENDQAIPQAAGEAQKAAAPQGHSKGTPF